MRGLVRGLVGPRAAVGGGIPAAHATTHQPGGTDVITDTFTKGGVFMDPTGARNAPIWRAPYACTVTNVRGYRVGGTGATVNARKNGASNHLSGALSLTGADAWMDGGAVQNTALAAGDKLEVMLVSISGLPTEVTIEVDLTRP